MNLLRKYFDSAAQVRLKNLGYYDNKQFLKGLEAHRENLIEQLISNQTDAIGVESDDVLRGRIRNLNDLIELIAE